ncbi:MAG: globin domain-containing protein, partial [Alphaproteobacteria bacterium]
MTPSQIRLVRDSFRKIEPIANQVGQAFYDKLFEAAPETRKLFKRDMSFQHEKFMSVVNELVSLHLRSLISLPVTLLNSSEAAMPTIYELGKRHIEFGVTPAHFGLMRSALIETLAELLGDEFTPQMQEAWEAAFDVMATVMKKGLTNTSTSSEAGASTSSRASPALANWPATPTEPAEAVRVTASVFSASTHPHTQCTNSQRAIST